MPELENYINRPAVALGLPKTPEVNVDSSIPGEGAVSVNDYWKNKIPSAAPIGVPDIPLSSFYTGERFEKSRPFTDYEEMAAQQQSAWKQWGNGLLKTVGTTASSFVGGTAGLVYGIGSAFANQRFSALYDNSVTREIDDFQKNMEDWYPNYYTHEQQDAEWYSPENILTANFWSDKVLKNMGYGLGSIAGGGVWSKAFKLIGVTNALVKAGVGLEAATATEAAMTAVPKTQKFAAFSNTLNSLAQKYIKSPIGSVLKNSDRIITSTMGTFGEASMEALQGLNDFRKSAIQEYINKYGYAPSGQDLDEINSYADKIGNYVFGFNTLLLTGTNYVQLPKILSSSKTTERAMINSIEQEGLGGAWTKSIPKTRFGKVMYKAGNIRRMMFSPSEAFEEGMQTSIQTGVNNYFDRAYDSKTKADSIEFFDALSGAASNVFGYGIANTLNTKEGMESILIGGLSGGIQQIRENIKERGIGGTGGYMGRNTDIAVSAINKTNIQNVLKDYASFVARGIGSQTLRQQAIRNNDTLSEKDYEADYVASYVMPRVKYGKVDSIYNELSYYESQAMDNEGFEQLKTEGIVNQNETREQFLKRIGSLRETAKNVDKTYDAIRDKYSGEIIRDEKGNPILNENKREQRKYSDDVIDKMVYAAMKIANYDGRIPQVNIALLEAGINSQEILESIIKNNKPNSEATRDALNKINDMDTTSDVKDKLKSDLSDLIELSLRRKMFIDEYDDVKQNPQNYEILPGYGWGVDELDTTPVDVIQKELNKEGREEEVEKKLEIGRQYSLEDKFMKDGNTLQLAPKISVLSQTLGGELEVRLPSGKTTFMTPEEFKEYKISDEDNSSKEMADLMDEAIDRVLDGDEYKDIKSELDAVQADPATSGVSKLDFVNSLDDEGLINDIEKEFKVSAEELIKRQAEEKRLKEALIKNKENIEKEQKEIETKSGPVNTGNPENETWDEEEGKRKSAAILYTSSTTESEGWSDPRQSPADVKRSRQFLNNLKNFANRANIKAILVTPKQLSKLGLDGLVQVSFGMDPSTKIEDVQSDIMNIDNGFVAQVFILQENGKNYFVDENGNKLSEVGQQVDVNKAVFQRMPTTALFTSRNTQRYRSNEEAEAKAASQAWSKFREQLFNAPDDAYTVYDFIVSRGIPRTTTAADGTKEKHQVGDHLIPQSKVATQENLILIPTTGAISHNGELIKVPNGRPVLQYGDTLEFLSNKKFSPSQARTIYELMKAIAEDTVNQSKAGKPIKINRLYSNFLQNVLYWRLGNKTTEGSNQIFLDSSNLYFGGKTFSLVNFEQNEQELLDLLENTYNNVNKEGVAASFHSPFTELYFEDGEIKEREWKNYQSYLLASTYPDGKKRGVDETPLTTSVSPKTDELPYTHQQKYSTLVGLELPYTKVTAPQATQTAAPTGTTVPKIGEYSGDKTNTITLKEPIGEVKFTFTVENGKVEVEAEGSPKTEAISKDPAKFTPYIDALKQLGKFDATKSVEESIVQFISLNISARLQKAYDEQTPAAPAQAPQAAPVSDKKADIEKTLYGTISGSIPLSQALPNGVYTDLGNGLFAYADKNDKIAAIVDRTNGYIVSKSFWNEKQNKWQLPNQANLKDDAKKLGVDEATYIKKYQDAVDSLNKAELAASEGATAPTVATPTQAAPSTYVNRKDEILAKYRKETFPKEQANVKTPATQKIMDYLADIIGIPKIKLDPNTTEYYDWLKENLGSLKDLPGGTYLANDIMMGMNGPEYMYLKLTEFAEQQKELPVFKLQQQASTPSVTPTQAAPVVQQAAPARSLGEVTIEDMNGNGKTKIKDADENNYILKNLENGALYAASLNEADIPNSDKPGGIAKFVRNSEEANTGTGFFTYNASREDDFALFDTAYEWAKLKKDGKTNLTLKQYLLGERDTIASTQTKPYDPSNITGPSDDYRLVASGEEGRMTDEEFELFKRWHAENVPGIPFEVLDRLVTTHDGQKAWGVFENGVAKFVRGGLKGTEYHEVFEGIWKGFLSQEERDAIINELRESGEDFIDRQTGKKLNYATATEKQIKERIADDFSDFRLGKLPAASLGGRIRNFFKMIMDFFKSFIFKPTLKEELFKAIDTGKFKEKAFPESVKNEAAEYRAVEGLTEPETHEYVQDMTARAAGILFNEAEKRLLFSPERITSTELFNKIKEKYTIENKMQALGEKRWNELVKKTKESLRTLGISFNLEDRVDLNDEETNKNDYVNDTFKTDYKKSSPFAIKFTLATLLKTVATNQENVSFIELPKAETSSVLGYRLLNFSRAFGTVLDRMSNTTSVSKAVDKLLNLAKSDSDYVRLFQRLGGKIGKGKTPIIPFNDFKNDDWRLFIQFMQVFTKQKPQALIQYKTGNEVYMAPANIYDASKQIQQGWIENIRALAKNPKSYIKYNGDTKTYKVDVQSLRALPLRTPQEMVDFLSTLGVEFPLDVYTRLSAARQNTFANAVSAIRAYIEKANDVASLTGNTIGVSGQFAKLAELLIVTTNPLMDTTYFGVDGKRIQSFSENNAPSVFENEFNESETLDELLEKRPELKDLFSTNSQILKKGGLFWDENGNRVKSMKIKYIQGTKLIDDNKGKATSKLGVGERFTQELNQNLNGDYYILVPADGSTEWMMNLGNNISFLDVEGGRAWKKINKIFKGYLIDDVALALDADNRKQLRNVGNKAKELRFFKDILSKKTLEGINNLIETDATQEQIEKYIDENIEDINNSIKQYIDSTVAETREILVNNKQIVQVKDGQFVYKGLDDTFANKEKVNKFNMTNDDVNNILTFANANYIINNIEFHKVLFGDPYQFAIKDKNGKIILDETKRIKSFLSPRRTTFDSPEYNTFLNQNLNNVGEETLQPGDPGYNQFKPYVNTVTAKDVKVVGSLANLMKAYGDVNEADAASWITPETYRETKLKNGQWTDEAEAFYQWQMAYTRAKLAEKGDYTYANEKLKKADAETIKKPAPKYAIEVIKPIVSGVKYNQSTINLVLDKFSQMPIFYSMVEGRSLEKMYMQMMKSGVGYVIVESGRKVGAEQLHSLYTADGSFNTEAFNNNIQVPWKAYGIQVENSFVEKEQTRGSQLTKMSSMDLFENGEASEKAKEEYKRNKEILDNIHRNAYKELLKKLNIVDTGEKFETPDGKSVSEVLMKEMMRRELSDNAKDTIQLDENNQFRIPFEASPSYSQIRNILYSLIDKSIRSPKTGGGAHVQVPVTGFEIGKKGLMRKVDGKWVKIGQKEYKKLSDEEKKGVVITDDTLKFYTKEDPYCEIMLPHWFRKQLDRSNVKTDEEILEYLNSTEEGKKILRGIGFRIPTQSMSSVEVFRVKGFLPQYMGYTVVVPSEIVTKAGSDFDIDKLNMYLKSIYIDARGDIRLVEYRGSEEATKDFFTKVYEETIQKDIDRIERFDEFRQNVLDIFSKLSSLDEVTVDTLKAALSLEEMKFYKNHSSVIEEIINQASDNDISPTQYLSEQIKDLANVKEEKRAEMLNAKLKDEYVSDMYRRSLENEYYDSLEKMLTLPENFDRLITPVDDAGLKDIADKLDDLRGYNESNIKNRILNRNYMTLLRHAFITGKKWVGIAAVNITNHSLCQKAKVYIDPERFAALSKFDRNFLGNGQIALPHNKVMVGGKEYISLSGKMTADGKFYISDGLSGYATSFVDVAKDPYILKIISSDLAVGTAMFLQRVGVPLETAAMFMNQPIIKEYLTYLDSTAQKGLFKKDNIEAILQMFPTTSDLIAKSSVNVNNLEGNIRDYYAGKSNDTLNAEQQVIFSEFLKYAKMAEFNFKFTQALNYDTTKFSSGDTLFKKQNRTATALQSNIISSVKDVMDKSFIGEQARILDLSMEAMGAILKTEEDKFRVVMDAVLSEFAQDEYMSADDYEKIANKIRASFLDYIIQTKTGLNKEIKSLLVDTSTSVAARIAEAKKSHPEVKILHDFQVTSSDRVFGAKSLKLMANIKDAYDENLYTGYMREMRDNPATRDLYYDVVMLSILQGTYQSAISIKNIIPIEDYSEIISPIIAPLVADQDVQLFAKGYFQRNNWKDEDVMPTVMPKFFLKQDFPVSEDVFGNDVFQYYSPAFPNIELFKIMSTDRKILLLGEKYNMLDTKSDFIKVPRVVVDGKTGERIDMQNDQSVSNATYAIKKAQGDPSLRDVYGYQKVKDEYGNPLIASYDNKGNATYVYKMINLYGDGMFASEYNINNTPSDIDNGTVKISQEIPNADIINYYGGKAVAPAIIQAPVAEVVPTAAPVSGVTPKGEMVKEGIYVNQGALTKDEQLELFNYLKPFLEEQAAKTNKGAQASKMIGLGLRWDYKSNNPGKQSMNIPDVIQPGNKNKYGYYNTSINGQPLGQITPRFRELMEKATGVDMTHYDGAIINLYDNESFISTHNDVDESRSAIKYPVIGINLGGTGNFSIESRDGNPKQLNLKAGTGYVFGVDGTNRAVFHRTFPGKQDSFLPQLTTKLDGKTYEPGSYRVTITMRRVMPLEEGMPTSPNIISQPTQAEKLVTSAKVSTPSGKLKLKDGKEYLISDINSELLKSIGYKPAEIGKLLKSIC